MSKKGLLKFDDFGYSMPVTDPAYSEPPISIFELLSFDFSLNLSISKLDPEAVPGKLLREKSKTYQITVTPADFTDGVLHVVHLVIRWSIHPMLVPGSLHRQFSLPPHAGWMSSPRSFIVELYV